MLVVAFPGMPVKHLLALAAELRRNGVATQLYFKPDVVSETVFKGSMRDQLSYANAAGIPLAVLMGEDELKAGKVSIKDLTQGRDQRAGIQDREAYRQAGKSGQVTVERADMVRVVKEKLAGASTPT